MKCTTTTTTTTTTITTTTTTTNNSNNNNTWYTHMPKPVCEEGDVTVLWNQAVHTHREVTANRPDMIIKNKK